MNDTRVATIAELVEHAAHYLPAQGPITGFVHHNTLHAFEHLPFEAAVEQAAALYGCEPYLSEERYRSELESGNIRPTDLRRVLNEEFGPRASHNIAGLVSRTDLYFAMLANPVRLASDTEVQWVVEAGDGVRSFRRRCPPLVREQMLADTRRWVMRNLRLDSRAAVRLRDMSGDILSRWRESRIERWDAMVWEELTLTLLWRMCRSGVHGLPTSAGPPAAPVRLRDVLKISSGVDPDELVHGALIPFCAVFADQGLAAWRLPNRDDGFYRCFLSLHGKGYPIKERWLRQAEDEFRRLARTGCTPEESILESLAVFGTDNDSRQDLVTRSLLALRGWAGMLRQLELRPDRVRHPVPKGTLTEFLAVRLLLDRFAAEHVARDILRCQEPLGRLSGMLTRQARVGGFLKSNSLTTAQRAYLIFLLAQSLGWSPRRLSMLKKPQWEEIVQEIEGFPGMVRRRLFQRAYEYRFRHLVLEAISVHRGSTVTSQSERPEIQVICCIDEREESLRRHIEEIVPHGETFGTAGFFGIAMYYRGSGDADDVPLCPVAIQPRHRVREMAVPEDRPKLDRRRSWQRRFGLATRGIHTGSRGIIRALPTSFLGSLAAIPLTTKVLFPRLSSRLRKSAAGFVQEPIRTELKIERDPCETPQVGSLYDGFAVDEMCCIVDTLLRNIGLTKSFSRLILVIGHGSSSLNNPHEAAHDCGACGGGRGGPNARAFALMGNHPEVRVRLAAGGLIIPEDAVFLGVYHNTCDDSFVYYDVERIPATHLEDYNRAQEIVAQAGNRNAHERCRRFRSVPLLVSPETAKRRVEARAEDLAQPRPEFGHATNAVCVVGRRKRTAGLFMDRRAFLVSYDPSSDADDTSSPTLKRILQAVLPVCAGINLEYYFSYVDPCGWGCGTKLPHNITSLLGVMDGSASDLRPGLPWQMVEIHDPVRLTVIVETTPARLLDILKQDESMARLCRNGWVHLATLNPDSARVHVFVNGAFQEHLPELTELPTATSSARWYSGLREHLEFAAIEPEFQGRSSRGSKHR